MQTRLRSRLRRTGRVGLMRAGNRWHGLRRKAETIRRYVELGSYARESNGGLPPTVPHRFDLFAEALARVDGVNPLYLEFGVYQGESFRWWCENLKQPGARLVGFDSFEGLPEDWHEHMKAGAFAVDSIPEFDDPRSALEIGWFDATLPTFTVPDHDQLIVNIDADLYSSASYVLNHLDDYLVPGTLVYFDELSDVDHELKAWREFVDRRNQSFDVIGLADGGTNWLFRLT